MDGILLRAVTALLFVIVGIVNLLPVTGMLGTERMASAYRVSIDTPDLAILMKHRAMLFAIVGGLLIASAFRPELRTVATMVGLVSMLGFAVIYFSEGGNSALARIAWIDIIASLALVLAYSLHLFRDRT
ncbi:MAG: hypothetical protein WA906_12180 [Pacificimonas sp.]